MSIHDLREFSDLEFINTQVCIVGAGPAGLSLALQFAGTGINVCVLESGGLTEDPQVEALSAFDSIGMRRANSTRRRGFGGTSSAWTGRCGVFDPIDFQERPWVPFSGWPISSEDIEPYFERAGRLLGLGPILGSGNWPEFIRRQYDDKRWDPQMLQPVVFQFSRASQSSADAMRTYAEKSVDGGDNLGALKHPGAPQAVNYGKACRGELDKSENIKVLLYANATGIQTTENGNVVRSVTVCSSTGVTATVHADVVVLACGGVDNARLLLASDSQNPRGVGNSHGMVGRFLTDHPLAFAGIYTGEGSREFRRKLGHRWLDRSTGRHIYQLGLRLSPELQRRERLLNCAFHLIEYGEQLPAVTIAGNVLRELKARGWSSKATADLLGIASDPLGLLRGVYDRYVAKQPALTKPDTVAVCCVVEQQLDPESRVRLSETRDELGMRRALIDWRVADAEFATAKRGTEVLIAEMLRLGLQVPEAQAWIAEGPDAFRSEIHDMAHPMCSTRMSGSPFSGTVDSNCQVHGVDGLYIAGSSVFSTPGYMNPTLMIVALSLRLADHVKRTHFLPRRAPLTNINHQSPGQAQRRVRVGFIGTGDRIRRTYLPILESLADEFELAGVTSRTSEKAIAFAQETGSTFYPDGKALAEQGEADFIVVAVSSGSVDALYPSLLNLPCPMLFETPFCWNILKGRQLLRKIDRSTAKVGIAEQTPFLPHEQIKRKLIDLGLIGRISALCDDLTDYDYHSIAAFRSHVNGDGRPAQANCAAAAHPGRTASGRQDHWTNGTIGLEDGTRLTHNYSGDYYASASRGPRIIRLYGTTGSIVDADVSFEDRSLQGMTSSIRRHCLSGRLQKLSVETPIGAVEWINPFSAHDFSDEQIAVASLLRSMARVARDGGLPLYTARRALDDMETMTAIRISANIQGSSVKIPASLAVVASDVLRSRIRKRLIWQRRTNYADLEHVHLAGIGEI